MRSWRSRWLRRKSGGGWDEGKHTCREPDHRRPRMRRTQEGCEPNQLPASLCGSHSGAEEHNGWQFPNREPPRRGAQREVVAMRAFSVREQASTRPNLVQRRCQCGRSPANDCTSCQGLAISDSETLGEREGSNENSPASSILGHEISRLNI